MKQLLVICGPTATGKTSLALRLAKKFDGELISADSRQVYKKLDIGTGKDIPQSFEFRNSDLEFEDFSVGYFTNGKTRLWGYDLVEPTEEFSVGQYIKIANKIINNIEKREKLPILVGGTGLYIQGVVNGISTASVPKNAKLRKKLEKKNVDKLFEILSEVTPTRANSLNESDRKNPRRLIRAIEIATSPIPNDNQKSGAHKNKRATLSICLTAPKNILDKRIEKRVEKRIGQGVKNEIKNLLEQGVNFDNQSMQALGYKQWISYNFYLAPESSSLALARGKSTGQEIMKKKVIETWKRAEKQYAKRQMTWFKKSEKINWFDITKNNWQKNVEELVRKWYKL